MDKRRLRLKTRMTKGKEVVRKGEQRVKEYSQKYEERLRSRQILLAERKERGKSTEKLEVSIKKLKTKHKKRVKRDKERIDTRKQRNSEYIEKLELQIKEQKKTRDYNLTTSLKSYIDPRIYCTWGEKVDFDWKLYYPKALQRKFSWVELNENNSTAT